jgi:hypothetical protein
MRIRWVLLFLLVPGLAWSEDLAESARRERERRAKAAAEKKKDDASHAYTQDDLATAGGGKGNANILTGPAPGSAKTSTTGSSLRSGTGTPVVASSSSSGSASGSASTWPTGSTSSGSGEAYWRSRSESLRTRVTSSRVRVQTADKAMAEFTYGPPSDGGCGGAAAIDYRTGGIEGLKQGAKTPCKDAVAEWNERRNRAANELDAAKAALTAAEKELAGLDEEARRAGALPGWIR